jgi:hypothetical protein
MIVRPETVIRWHRARFRRCWRWKSKSLGGRPPISVELRTLIWRMSHESVLWGAEIHDPCANMSGFYLPTGTAILVLLQPL